jgi:hypothetical protein
VLHIGFTELQLPTTRPEVAARYIRQSWGGGWDGEEIVVNVEVPVPISRGMTADPPTMKPTISFKWQGPGEDL